MANADGRFITIEGSEGAGKSTNMQTVCALLDQHGINYYATREPGGTPVAEALRELMLSEWQESVDGITELLIVFAARNQHLATQIRPRLAAGQWVVCDRFTDATYAYQGGGRGVAQDAIADLERLVQGSLRPDLTLYLDLDPAVGRARIAERAQDRLEQEQLDFFQAVRTAYLARAASQTYFHTIDAAQSVAQVAADIRACLDERLRQWGLAT